MKILEFRQAKYQRMKLNHIEYFDYKPKSKIQIIIGSNGSGKSSLLNELSPLPANHKNYAQGGYKYIKIEHRGSIYELKNDFEKGQSHSFIKDGEELNTGTGTVTVQYDLVQKYFGINPKIHELALGIRKFHAMPVAERREWFTLLSDANYDYAIGVYNRIREKSRDISGAIKIAKKNLSLETNKIFSDTEIKALEDKCQSLYQLVQTLLEYRVPVTVSVEQSLDKAEELKEEIYNKTKELGILLNKINPFVSSLSNLEQDIEKLKAECNLCKSLSDRYYKDHEKITEQFNIAKKLQQQSIVDLKQDIEKIRKQIEDRRLSYHLKLEEVADPGYSVAQIESIYNWLDPIVLTFKEYKGREDFNIEAKSILETNLELLINKSRANKEVLDRNASIVAHLNSLKNNDKVECPNCKHQWIVGYDQELFDRASAIVAQRSAKDTQLQALIETEQKSLSELTSYLQALEQFNKLIYNTDGLQRFWDYILAEDIIHTAPENIYYLLDRYKYDLETQKEVIILTDQIKRKNASIKEALENKGLDYEYILKSKENLELDIASLQDRHRVALKHLKIAQELLNDSKTMDASAQQLNSLVEHYNEFSNETVEALRRTTYNDMLRSIQATLAKHEARLHEVKNHQQVIKNLENQISQLENEERCLKAAAKELSPTEGLIAEGLFGFMKLFIGQMNNFIKRIWTYPLVLQPCALGSDGALDLDYRFPVVVDTADNIRKDISEGSSAMHEVIDLAFKITAMKALRLEDFPLFLDEFGSTMDPTHKAATIQLINSIMEQDHFTQLFMISHDAVQYGALSNTEVCVLSADNMMLPKGMVYNQHVKINETA